MPRKQDPELYHQVGRIIKIIKQERNIRVPRKQDPELYHQVGRIIKIIKQEYQGVQETGT